jgi:AraC-like DNA-binding protein
MFNPSQQIFANELLRIGIFRCPAVHPSFTNTGPIISGHLLVFPRTSVCITHEGGAPILADPNIVMFYNRYQVYERRKVSPNGDHCEWFAFAPDILAAALQTHDQCAMNSLEQPFRFTHSPCNASSYLNQRLVVEHILNNALCDTLFIEETMLGVLEAVLRLAYLAQAGNRHDGRSHAAQEHARIVHRVQELLAIRYHEQVTLTQLASEVNSSPFQLCRIFRRQTGFTIHQYLNQLRLRAALEAVAQGANDLTGLALDLGFANHSHFTHAFRQAFQTTPSHLRNRLSPHPKRARI